MSEQRFVLDKLYYTIMTPIEKISVGRSYMTYGEVVGCLNELNDENKELKKENEQLKKRVDKLKVIMAEFGATLLMNGFDIEFDDKDLIEMINNE